MRHKSDYEMRQLSLEMARQTTPEAAEAILQISANYDPTPPVPRRSRWLDVLSIAALLVPVLVMLRLVGAGLYASPETDDFCFAYHYLDDGLSGTIAIFYKTAIGRVLPMVLMTIPAMISKATSIDFFIVYPLVMIAFLASLVVLCTWAATRLWPGIPTAVSFFFGLMLAATISVNALSLREMFYWLPGAACYLIPAGMLLIILLHPLATALYGRRLTSRATAVLGVLCFAAATCNEFTPIWIMASIAASFALRRFSQFRQHAVLAACTTAGFLVLLAAPGNLVRMSQYPAGRRFAAAIDSALTYFDFDWMLLLQQPSVIAWLVACAVATVFVFPGKPIRLWEAFMASFGLAALFLACSFMTSFIAYYATGEILALRARNEIEAIIIIQLSIAVITLSRVATAWLPSRPAQVQAVGIILCAALAFNLFDSRAMDLWRNERGSFNTFWLETMQRHATLSLSTAANVAVPARTVRPSTLMQEDLTSDPSRLPNDCVGAFYGKRSVVVSP